MKYSFIASAAMIGLVAAQHGHGHKHMHAQRDDGVVTLTSEIVVTDYHTVWVAAPTDDPAQQAASNTLSAAVPKVSKIPAKQSPGSSVLSLLSAQSASTATSVAAPAPAPVESTSTSSSSAAAAPTSSSTGGGQTFTNHFTYYNPGGADGSCGTPLTDSSQTVALAPSYMKAACGKKVTIVGPAGTFTATVADTCEACKTDNHIDIPQAFAAQIVGSNAELVKEGNVPCTWTLED